MELADAEIPRTMFEKIWARHRVVEREDGQTLLYVDRQLVHDSSAPSFDALRARSLPVRAPSRNFAVPDHYVPTDTRQVAEIVDPVARGLVEELSRNAIEHDLTLFDLADARQGIVHVVGPEQGISQPGMVIVCCDSHTSTHGAFGALAFGIGATEVTHVLATQTLWQRRPQTMRLWVDGSLPPAVAAKDLILSIISQIGAAGAVGHVIEYAGPTMERLSMEERMTICNMSIEAGARAGMIAPDDITFSYLSGRPFAPTEPEWSRRVCTWRALRSDPGARFDRDVTIDASRVAPMVTWGTSPQDAVAIDALVPDPAETPDEERRDSLRRALEYMGLEPGRPLIGTKIDRVFIGSCTNGRIEDLRSAAAILRGRQVADGVTAWAVPGSGLVKAQAEREGLDAIFIEAGVGWRHAGCSLCLGTNGETVPPGARCASTSNRNFVGRQGPGARTHLMSPAMAAAAAVAGVLVDVRQTAQMSS